MTALEARMYVALLGARTIVSATANVNPKALKILRLMDSAIDGYKGAKDRETANAPQLEEETDATGE